MYRIRTLLCTYVPQKRDLQRNVVEVMLDSLSRSQNSFSPLYLTYLFFVLLYRAHSLQSIGDLFNLSPFCIATSSYSPPLATIAHLTSTGPFDTSHSPNKMKAYPCSTVDEIDFRDEITITATESTSPFCERTFRRQIRLRRQDFRQL